MYFFPPSVPSNLMLLVVLVGPILLQAMGVQYIGICFLNARHGDSSTPKSTLNMHNLLDVI